MGIAYFEHTAETRAIGEALRRNGAVAVTGVADPALIDDVVSELRPQLDEIGLNMQSAFNGDKTLRIAAGILTSAPSAACVPACTSTSI